MFLDPDGALHLTTNILPILTSAGAAPSSHPLLALNRLHQSLLIATLVDGGITQDKLNEAIRVAARSCSGLESLLVEGHPVRAIAKVELGKLLSVDEPSPSPSPPTPSPPAFPPSGAPRLKLAYQTLLQALQELLIGFGKDDGGEAGKEVREEVARLEKELEVWKGRGRDALEYASR